MGEARGDDGRLELDELGDVVDGATSIDPDRTDVLAGPDGTTWTERLESAGVTPWLRRHGRVLLGAAAVVVVGAGAVLVHQRSLPPPEDPVIRASVTDARPDTSVTAVGLQGGPDLVQVAVAVRPLTPGDRVVVHGLVGPGIGASQAAPDTTANPAAGAFTLGVTDLTVVPACDVPLTLLTGSVDYRVAVTRTDAAGRVRDAQLDVPLSLDQALAQQLAGECALRQVTESVTAAVHDVHAGPAAGSLVLDVALHDGLTQQVVVVVPSPDSLATVASTPVQTALYPGASAILPVTMTVRDCSDPTPDLGQSRHDLGHVTGGQTPTLTLGASIVGGAAAFLGGQVDAALDPATHARIRGLLRGFCTGLPATTVRVVAAHPLPDAPYSPAAVDLTTLELRLLVRTSATRVALVGSPADTGSGALTGARAATAAGSAVLTTEWAVTCSGANPPVAQLLVTGRGPTYPVLVTLADPVVEKAYRDACPALGGTDLASLGWPQ